jgi:hypothetical protein
LYQLNRSCGFSLFFGRVRFASSQLTLSPPFPLLGAASPLVNVVMPLCHVTLRFHRAKMSSLPPLRLPTMFHSIVFPLKPKMKHWIRITAVCYPHWTAWLPPCTAIKDHLNLDHFLYHSTMSLFCLLPKQSITSSKLHPLLLFPFTTVSFTSSLRITTHMVMN